MYIKKKTNITENMTNSKVRKGILAEKKLCLKSCPWTAAYENVFGKGVSEDEC